MTDDAVSATAPDPSGLDEPALTWQEVVKWWEVRRIYYNLILLGVGIVSMALGIGEGAALPAMARRPLVPQLVD